VHVSGQNAGLLVTRVDTEILYESLELLAPDGIATGCRGRLRRCFPTHTVAVSQSHVEDVTFQQPFVKVLAQLSAHEEKPRPSLVTEMVMGVLRGIGRIVRMLLTYPKIVEKNHDMIIIYQEALPGAGHPYGFLSESLYSLRWTVLGTKTAGPVATITSSTRHSWFSY